MMKSSMNEIDSFDAADGPVVGGGGPAPSTFSKGRAGPLAPGQRWSAARKREVVLRLLRGEAAELLSRELGLPLFKLEQWRQKAATALESALKERETDPAEGQLAAARSLPSPTRICWRRSGPTSHARPGPVRAIARCGPDCGRLDGIQVS